MTPRDSDEGDDGTEDFTPDQHDDSEHIPWDCDGGVAW
jgi:hypothetical protein